MGSNYHPASYAGWLTAVAGVVFALATVIRKLVNPDIPAGWASTISVLLLLGGMIIALIGVVGAVSYTHLFPPCANPGTLSAIPLW